MCDVLKSLPYTLLLRGPLYCLTFGFPKLSGGSQSSGRPVVETEVSLGNYFLLLIEGLGEMPKFWVSLVKLA